jgi:hypothetical protein
MSFGLIRATAIYRLGRADETMGFPFDTGTDNILTLPLRQMLCCARTSW